MLTGVPQVTYKAIKPISWPQDELNVPNGYGAMKTIDFNNARNVRQEGFSYTGTVVAGAGQVTTLIIPIAADADFWATQILFQQRVVAAQQLSPKVQITDVRSGYQFGFPYLRFHNFVVEGAWSTNMTGSHIKANRTFATLPKPFCFVRNSGIKIDVTNGSAGAYTCDFGFSGWKEFADVSR